MLRTFLLAITALPLLTACENQLRAVDTTHELGASLATWEDEATSTRIETFQWGGEATTTVADYLFVVDPSISMRTVIGRVQRAFDDLATSEAFPSKARIGVISMLPANPRALARPHPAVTRFPGIEAMPGFVDLVDARSIRAFRNVSALDHATQFPLDGCDPWFAPGAKSEAGVPCLTAHTQIPLASVRAEAGLVAVEQLVARKLPGSVFRLGAAVNIIFVSDTHDPGTGPRDDTAALRALLELTPDPERLQTTIQTASATAAVRFHAIAPVKPCGEVWSPAGDTYIRAAKASGGEVLDICSATDYTAFIQRIATAGAKPEHGVFPVGRDVASLEEVYVDGRAYPARAHHGRVVEVDKLDPNETHAIEVHYRFAPPLQMPRRLGSGDVGITEGTPTRPPVRRLPAMRPRQGDAIRLTPPQRPTTSSEE